MAKKKHVFHCTKCGNPCSIYHKGKAHRLLVCPTHGILAVNPGLGATLGGLAGALVPVAGETGISEVAGAYLGDKIEGLIRGKHGKNNISTTAATSERAKIRHSYSTEERVHDALAR